MVVPGGGLNSPGRDRWLLERARSCRDRFSDSCALGSLVRLGIGAESKHDRSTNPPSVEAAQRPSCPEPARPGSVSGYCLLARSKDAELLLGGHGRSEATGGPRHPFTFDGTQQSLGELPVPHRLSLRLIKVSNDYFFRRKFVGYQTGNNLTASSEPAFNGATPQGLLRWRLPGNGRKALSGSSHDERGNRPRIRSHDDDRNDPRKVVSRDYEPANQDRDRDNLGRIGRLSCCVSWITACAEICRLAGALDTQPLGNKIDAVVSSTNMHSAA